MSTKADEAKAGCFASAADNEPVFVLRAQDKLAPELVRRWAHEAELNGCPHGKIMRALETADAMENWPNRKFPD